MGTLKARVSGQWVTVGGTVDAIWVDPNAPSDPNIELWYDTDAFNMNYGVVTPWVVPTFQNGWTAFDAGRTPQYRKVGDEVQLRGILKPGTSATVAFALPAGFRPFQTDDTFMPVSNATPAAQVSCASGGNVTVTAAGGATFVYLSGIRFSTVA